MKPLFKILACTFVLSTACVHPTPPVPPPPPTPLIPIGIVTQNADSSRIPGASVSLNETDGRHVQTTDATGFTLFNVPATLIFSDVDITAAGYDEFRAHVDVVSGKNYFYTLTPTPLPFPQPQVRSPLVLEPDGPNGLVCHHDQLPNLTIPATPDPRFWRGDAWGVTVPGLPFVNGGSSRHPERALSWFFDRWDEINQQKILVANRQRGYTHFALSWPDSRDGNGQSVSQFVSTAAKVHSAIPYVPIFLTSKLYDPKDADATTRMAGVTPVIDALLAAKVTNIFVVGWELDLFNDGQKLEDFIDALDARYHGQIDLYVHFTTYKTSWQPDGQPRAQFWEHLKGKLTGLLYQGNPSDSCGLMSAHFNDAMIPASGLQAAGAILIPWELVAESEFDRDRPNEDDANARNWEVMNTPGPIVPSGFGNGARYPSGQPTLVQY